MTKRLVLGLALLAGMGASGALAAVGDGIVSGDKAGLHVSATEEAQFMFGRQRYCFYGDGWQGPGWYWCGYNWRRGFGWGGGEGWNGWEREGGRRFEGRREEHRPDWRREERPRDWRREGQHRRDEGIESNRPRY